MSVTYFVPVMVVVAFVLGGRYHANPEVVPLEGESDARILMELWHRYTYLIGFICVILMIQQVYFLWRVARWFFRICKNYCKVYRDDAATLVGNVVGPLYVPEKFIPGSDYHPSTMPAFQVEIWKQISAATYAFVGNAWRLDELLVTAHHVVAGLDVVRVKVADKFVDVDGSRFEHTDNDLAVCVMARESWATLAVKSAKIPKQAIQFPVVATICSRGMASSGMLEPYHVTPYTTYQGSTQSGFSGAPIFVGNTVYALHVGAGKVNLSLDANWIKSVAFRREETTDFILDAIKTDFTRGGKKLKYRMWGADEIYVLSRGSYHAVPTEDIAEDVWRMLEHDGEYAAVTNRESVGTYHGYNDISSCRVREPSFLGLRQADVIAEARRLKRVGPAPKQNGVEMNLPCVSKATQADMGGLESMSAQLSRVSPNIWPSQRPSQNISRGVRLSRSRTRKPRLSRDLEV